MIFFRVNYDLMVRRCIVYDSTLSQFYYLIWSEILVGLGGRLVNLWIGSITYLHPHSNPRLP